MFSPKSPYTRSSKSQRFHGNNRSGSLLSTALKKTFASTSGDPTYDTKARNVSFGRSYQASILEETPQHTVVLYGNPLPVLVTEAITSSERIADISVKLEESGWASLVCGRRLFIWRYKQDVAGKNMGLYCHELTLPQSDLAHKADLVHVFTTHETQMPSALAVSPEGIVRYWPNIVHEGSSVEAATDLQGQECYSLTNVGSLGFILATTTSSLVLITPSASDGQHNVICRTLKVPQGVLAGIGRKVSSFIFGALPAQATEAKQLTKVLSVRNAEKSEVYLYVLLSSCTLQKWQLSKDEPDKLLFEYDFERSLKERYWESVWVGSSPDEIHQLKTWCLDMQLTQNYVVLLTVAMNPNRSKSLYYSVATIDVSDAVPATKFASFNVIREFEKYQIENDEKLLSFRMIFPSRNSALAYIYSSDEVFCLSVMDPDAENDLIDVSSWGDILGAAACDGLPLFFTKLHSVIALQLTQQNFLDASHVMMPQKVVIQEQSIIDPSTDSLPARLRSAMCLYYNDRERCQETINEMFPLSSISKPGDSLNTTVVMLSNQIIDDFPGSDPRWCESVPSGDSASSSLIILHQLEDKLKVHEYLINFLKAVGLFERLSTVKVQDFQIVTKVLLCEHAEKIVAAKAIRRFLVDFNELLDTAVRETLLNRKIELQNRLTHQDLFFREVSAVHTLFDSILELEEKSLAEDEDVRNIITTVNMIFMGTLADVLQYRQSKMKFYELPERVAGAKYLPWTSLEGSMGLRTVVTQQHSLNMQYLLKFPDDLQIQGAVFQQIVEITDFLLDGYASEAESLKGSDEFIVVEARYMKERNRLIRPLLEVKQYERAASLAEKYFDFDILMQLCEDTNSQERLQRYMLQFKEQGFSDYMFKWYLDKGMRNKVLVHPLGQQDELTHFLKSHDDLSWLHHIGNCQYNLAQKTLKELAIKESTYLSKKKTLLSLSKLAALASDVPVDIKNSQTEAINLEQDLIAHQENLPDTVVEACGLDPDTMRVLTPEELIEMYISDDNTTANSYDFKIAMELLHFIKKPPGDSSYENLRLHIWCKAILRDNWEDLDTNNPLDAIKDTVFFQVIELAFDQGVDLHDFVIPVDDLLQSPMLSSLSDSSNFTFLLRAGYEHIYKLID